MEPISLAVGIIPLYSAAIDLLDRVRDFRNFEDDSRTALLRFDASKLKLQDWAQSLGIDRGKLSDSHDARLDDPQTAAVIQNILLVLMKAFDKVDYRAVSLKLPLRQRSAGPSGWNLPDEGGRDDPGQGQKSSTRSRVAWATGGRAKLEKDVKSFEGLINILKEVVPPRESETLANYSHLNEKLDLLADFSYGLERLLEVATAQKQHDIDAWLDAIEDDDQHGKFLTLRLDGTCNWIHSHPAYAKWEARDFNHRKAKILWVSGPAGFGKTVLSASLIRHLETVLKSPLVHCFSSGHGKSLNDLDGVVRTWITQLVRENKAILELTYKLLRRRNTRRASREEIWTLLREAVSEVPECTLMLDGLDEYPSIDDRKRFLRNLKQATQATNTRIFLTSRYEYDIESELHCSIADSPKYTVFDCKISTADVQGDINLLSETIVATRLPKQEQSLRQELAAKMAERCDGQFLWLKFQQDRLRDRKSPKALRKLVHDMPPKLRSVYERTWNQIENLEESDRAVGMLRWLCFAYESLTVQDMAEALVINLNLESDPFLDDDLPSEIDDEYIDGEIKFLCGSLVELSDRQIPMNRTVGLIHASAFEFLVEKLPSPKFDGLDSVQPDSSAVHHAALAAYCVRYLDSSAAWSTDGNFQEGYRSFTYYASEFWFRHLMDSGIFQNTVSNIVNSFLTPGNENFESWRHDFEVKQGHAGREPGTPFYYACLFGLAPVVDLLRGNEAININAIGGYYGTALQAVCVQQYTGIFDRLILYKADVTACGGFFGLPLNAATFRGNIHMVETLLDPTMSKAVMDPEIYLATILAAGEGHTEVVKLLLSHLTDLNSTDLSVLAPEAFGDMVLTATPLQAAARYGKLNVVGVLLERGADPNRGDKDGDTALHFAAARGFYDIVDLLLQHAADSTITGVQEMPLHIAASRGYIKVVKRLVECKVDLDAKNNLGMTPLCRAAAYNHLDVVEFLHERGANPNAQDCVGWTPLAAAASSGWLPIVTYLVKNGGDFNITNNKTWTPLLIALMHDHTDVAKFLIGEGAPLQALNDGWTPLHAASQRAQLDMMAFLLELGADVNARTDGNHTPLFIIASLTSDIDEELYLNAAKLLLRHGTKFIPDRRGLTPLHAAVGNDHPKMAAFFIDKGIDINAKSSTGGTPLIIAATNDRLEAAKVLVDRGADVNIVDIHGFTALSLAVRNQQLDLAKLLVGAGCTVNTVSLQMNIKNRKTVLIEAINRGSDEMIEYLIQSGADLSATDLYGMKSSDWLTRIRPNFVSTQMRRHAVDKLALGPDSAVMKSSLRGMANQSNDIKDALAIVYFVSRCFRLLHMEEDARLAYQPAILLAIDCSHRVPECDLCFTSATVDSPFYKCMICADIDLCQTCMEKYVEEDLLRICRGHDFMRVVAVEARERFRNEEEVDQWLVKVVKRIEDL